MSSKSSPPPPSSIPSSECVQVVIRCRPLSSDEKSAGNKKIVEMDTKLKQIRIKNQESKEGAGADRVFTMDNVFPESVSQESIYNDIGKSIVDSVLSGYNGTIFAYGVQSTHYTT